MDKTDPHKKTKVKNQKKVQGRWDERGVEGGEEQEEHFKTHLFPSHG